MNRNDDDMNAEDRDNPMNMRLGTLYRAAAQEEPTPALDAVLLTEAARAARPRRGRLWAWRPALATAAVMLLIAGMLRESPHPPAIPVSDLVARNEVVPVPPPASSVPAPADRLAQAPILDKRVGTPTPESTLNLVIARRSSPPAERRQATAAPQVEARTPAVEPMEPGRSADAPSAPRLDEPAPAPMASVAAPAPSTMQDSEVLDQTRLKVVPDKAHVMSVAPSLLATDSAQKRAAAEADRPAATVADGKMRQDKSEKTAPGKDGVTRLLGGLASNSNRDAYKEADISSPSEYATPEKWLDHIRELRRQGRETEAHKSMADFRKRYPVYVLPATLKDLEPPSAQQGVPAPPPAP